MKSKIKLTQEFICKLPSEVQDHLAEQLKEVEDVDNLHIHRKSITDDPKVMDAEESDKRITLGYHSTRTLDRDYDIIVPDGMKLDLFRKNPVLLFSHNWSEPPIGKLFDVQSDGFGLRGLSEYADTEFATEIWKLVKGGFLRTHSIGFIPTKWISKGDTNFNGMIERALREWPEFDPDTAEKTRNFVTEGVLLESSVVPIPSNVDSLIQEVTGKGYSSSLIKSLGIDSEVSNENQEEVPPNEDAPPESKENEIIVIKEPIRVIKRPKQSVVIPTADEVKAIATEQIELMKGRI